MKSGGLDPPPQYSPERAAEIPFRVVLTSHTFHTFIAPSYRSRTTNLAPRKDIGIFVEIKGYVILDTYLQ